MIRTYLPSDLRRNRLITFVIAMFILLAALLTATATGLFARLAGSIDRMMTEQKTPHFLQMHAGPADPAQVEAFADAHTGVADWQVQEFLNIDGSRIHIGENTLAASTQDNGLVVQSEGFDWLVDPEGGIIRPLPGEIWLPMLYRQNGTAAVGDPVVIGDLHGQVAGFHRDSQMNSALAGSKRILVSEVDYEKARPTGIPEALISFRLTEGTDPAAFEAAYQDANLPGNGPTVTWALFRVMNGITDGIRIAVFALASILVLLIAFLCLRFTLLARIEEDYREIGVMKAIGLRTGDIRRLYLAKYGLLAALSALAGFVLSLWLTPLLSENIRLQMGFPDSFLPGPLAGLAGAFLIFLVIFGFVHRVLGRFRTVTASEAVRFGAPDEPQRAKGLPLQAGRLPVNLHLGIRDILSRRRLYQTMGLVVLLSTFLLVVPQNIADTLTDRSFITYNGIGNSDLMISLQQNAAVTGEPRVAGDLKQDPDVSAYAVLTSRLHEVADEPVRGRIKVDTGDHGTFPITYTQGRAPEREDEIALSVLTADDYKKVPGDSVSLDVDGQVRKLTVTGLYSDITNGGKTAKALFSSRAEILWSTVYVDFAQGVDPAAKALQYAARYPEAKVAEVSVYFSEAIGTLTDALQTAARAAVAVTAVLVFLVTLLFVRMLAVKDRRTFAVLKTLGFPDRDLRRQILSRTLLTGAVSVIAGILLSNTLGEWFGTALIGSFGVARLRFAINPLFVFAAAPALLLFVIWLSTRLGATGLAGPSLSETLKE